MITVQKIEGKDWICNCYILHNGTDAVIIDPGNTYQTIKTHLGNLQLKAILVTHGHYDHIVNVAALKREYDVPFYIHTADSKVIKHANFYIKLISGNKATEMIEIPEVDRLIENEELLDFDFVKLQVTHIPGHTAGSVSFSFDNNLFTGDLLLKNEIGRFDLPGGNKEQLKQSVKNINLFFKNPVIFPGHGPNTTLDAERANNKQFIEIING